MAVRRAGGGPRELKARWFQFQKDEDHGDIAEVLCAPLDRDVAIEIQRKHEKPIRKQIGSGRGAKFVTNIEIPEDSVEEYVLDMLDETWLDTRHFRIVLKDDPAEIELFREAGVEDAIPGKEISLDRHLTRKVKKWAAIDNNVTGLFMFMSGILDQLHATAPPDEGVKATEEELRELGLARNLRSGSSSASATEGSPTPEHAAETA